MFETQAQSFFNTSVAERYGISLQQVLMPTITSLFFTDLYKNRHSKVFALKK